MLDQKQRSRPLKRRANNEQAQPSEVKHFMCYICGKMFTQSVEYQRHLVIFHQAAAMCYQIWQAKNGRYRRSKNRRLSVENEERTNSRNEEVTQAAHEVPDPPRTHVEQPKRDKSRERSEENKKRKRKNLHKKDDDSKDREPAYFNDTSLRSCDVCGFTCEVFHQYIAHYCDSHNMRIERVYMHLLDKNQTLIGRKVSSPGAGCPQCDLLFENDQSYFRHLISYHVEDIVNLLTEMEKFVNTRSVDVEIHLRNEAMFVSKSYNFQLRRNGED